MVTRHTELNDIPWSRVQITVGDYIVVSGDKIVAVIERKTLDDYGASLKDGRANNKQKMINLRKKTGCRIIYIIEGDAFPSPNDCYSNIPYKNI
jgi:ERCC4-type nuclease